MPTYKEAVSQSNAAVSGAVPSADVGWSLKGAFKKVGRGVKSAAKATGRGVKSAARTVRRNPIKSLAVAAVPGLGVALLAKKGIQKAVSRKGNAAPSDETETETQAADEYTDDTESSDDSEDTDGESSGASAMGSDIGWDEVSGDDITGDEISGARPKVRKRGLNKLRKQPMGFSSLAIAAGASAVIQVAAQTVFRGRRLVVNDYSKFVIQDIKVGNVSQLAGVDPIPAAAFAPETTGEDNLQMDTCDPGVYISVTVKNISAGVADFYAALFGDSAQ